MYTKISIKYDGHIIIFESGQHNEIIEHLRAMIFIALNVTISVEILQGGVSGEFKEIYQAIEFIEKTYYNLNFKEVKND